MIREACPGKGQGAKICIQGTKKVTFKGNIINNLIFLARFHTSEGIIVSRILTKLLPIEMFTKFYLKVSTCKPLVYE